MTPRAHPLSLDRRLALDPRQDELSGGLSRRAWPLKRRWALTAEKPDTAFEFAPAAAADLGDRPGRSCTPASCPLTVWFWRRLPDGDFGQLAGGLGSLRPCSSMKQLDVSSILPQRLAASLPTSCAPAWSLTPNAQPVVGPGGNRRGQTTSCAFRTKDDPGAHLEGKDAAKRCGKMLDTSSCHLKLRGRKHPRPPASWPKSPSGRRRQNQTVSGQLAVETADRSRRHRENRRSGPATAAVPARSPQVCACRREDRRITFSWPARGIRPSLPANAFQSAMRREASYVTGTCARKAICRPISDLSSSGRFNRRQEPVYAELSTLALPPRHQPAEPLTYSMLANSPNRSPCA